MARIVICDRCGQKLDEDELAYKEFLGFNEFFGDHLSESSEIGYFQNEKGEKILIPYRLKHFHFCQECLKEYNKIVIEANKKIEKYVKEKTEVKSERKPKTRVKAENLNKGTKKGGFLGF